MAEILDNVHFRLIYFDNCIFRSMIVLLKYERVVIVADWTVMSFPKKVRRSRPRKRERSTRRSTWESGVRRFVISWSSPSIWSHRQYQLSHHCQCPNHLHHQLIAGSDDNDGEENREATAEVFYKSSWLAEASKQVNMILIKEGLWKCCHRFRPRIHQYHQDSCALSGIITPKDPDPNFQRQT